MKKKRIVYITAGVLAAVLLIVSGILFYYFSIMKQTLNQVTTPEEAKTLYCVYVLNEDPAQNLSDTAGYRYGASATAWEQEEFEQVLRSLNEQLGLSPDLLEYEDLFTLVDGLKKQECRAIVLNEAYLISIAEAQGYEWVEDGLRKITSIEVMQTGQAEKEPSAPEQMPETFLMYISGIDTFGGISTRSRSDVNIIAAVNTSTKQILLLSTPRDYYVDFAATKGQKDKLTHAGIYGVEASMDALERLYDVDIDYYLRINFTGFVEIIDALGGIEVYSEYDFTVENIKNYHKGYNHLTGLEALAFARERYSFPSGDYQRAKNQMEVIRAVVDKCTSPAILQNFPAVMGAIAGSFETNMPQDQIMALITAQLTQNSRWETNMYTAIGSNAYRPTYSMPGRDLFVILPDPGSVQEAKQKLVEITSSR